MAESIRRGPLSFKMYEKSIGVWGPGDTGGDTFYLGRAPVVRDVDTLCRLVRLGARLQRDHAAEKARERETLVSFTS